MFELLILIVVANGSPIIVNYCLSNRLSLPVDFGASLGKQRILGDSKTWRGIVSSVCFTCIVAVFLGYEVLTGLLISLAAMSGDLFSSFIKRRLAMPSSSMAPLLDQVPESLFPALLVADSFLLNYIDIAILVACFVVIELILSRQLYKIGIRRRPY